MKKLIENIKTGNYPNYGWTAFTIRVVLLITVVAPFFMFGS